MKICKRIRPVLRKLAEYLDEQLERNIDTALSITTKVRDIVAGQTPSLVAQVILSHLPEKIRVAAGLALATAVDRLIGAQRCAEMEFLDMRVACYINILRGETEEGLDGATIKLAQTIAKIIDNRGFDTHIYDSLTQARISEMKILQ